MMKKKMLLLLIVAAWCVLGIQSVVMAGSYGPLLKAYEEYVIGLGKTYTTNISCKIDVEAEGQKISATMDMIVGIDGERFFAVTKMSMPQPMTIRIFLSGKNIYMISDTEKEYAVNTLSDKTYAQMKQKMQMQAGNSVNGEYLGSGTEMFGGSMMNYEDYELINPKDSSKFYARYYFDKNQKLRFIAMDMDTGKMVCELMSTQKSVDQSMFKVPSGYKKIDLDPAMMENMF